MKKLSVILLALALCLSVLAGCGGGDKAEATKTPAPPTQDTPKPATSLKVSVINSSGYIFNELYVSPTADTKWGDDHLGSTNILKKGGSYDITVPAYDYNTYDIRVVDEDEDTYIFKLVPLANGCEVDITWDTDLTAIITNPDGTQEYVTGTFDSGAPVPVPSDDDWIETTFYNNTSWDFVEVYVYEADSSTYGYNHVANGPLSSGSYSDIGVDYYYYYDIELLDSDDDTWFFEDVELDYVNYVDIDWENSSPYLTVTNTDGSTDSYLGQLL